MISKTKAPETEKIKTSKTDDELVLSRKHKQALEMSERSKKTAIDLTKKKVSLV